MLPGMTTANSDAQRPIVITGGAGFVGSHLAHRLLNNGHSVLIFDNLSSPGGEENITWLRENHERNLEVEVADIRNREAVRRAVTVARGVFHLAAQVALTTSLADPESDFAVNTFGTVGLLEELRRLPSPPYFIYASTNKVYGSLSDLPLGVQHRRYQPLEPVTGGRGIGESRRLEFVSPFGCSKGAADQYVLDYARSFGLPACVFRLGCVYGPRQRGTDEHSWVAHFVLRTLRQEPITIYGDGRQVRDLLFIDDLVDAFSLAAERPTELAGRAYNLGGGAANAVSLLELLAKLEELHGRAPELKHAGWRTGDQRYYVSDTRAFRSATGWEPKVGVDTGLPQLYRWLWEAQDSKAQTLRRAAP